ncbi:MAG: hypothetical protein J6S74_04270 [Alphaproteobacteria bacterium]|nr:hypothetical protein [Alphaproteobacteria bacterium]
MQQNCTTSGGYWDSANKQCDCTYNNNGKHWNFDTKQCENEVYVLVDLTTLTANVANCKTTLADLCQNRLGAQQQRITECQNALYAKLENEARDPSDMLSGRASSAFGLSFDDIMLASTPLSNYCGLSTTGLQQYSPPDWGGVYSGL